MLLAGHRCTIREDEKRRDAAAQLEGHPTVVRWQARAVRGKGQLETIRACKDLAAGAEPLQRRGQIGAMGDERGGRGRRQSVERGLEASEGFEQNRRRHIAAESAGNGCAIGAAHPDADHVTPVETDRPCVAVPIGGPGLVGHNPSPCTGGRGQPGKDVSDLPCRFSREQAGWIAAMQRRFFAAQRNGFATVCECSIKLDEIVQADTQTT